MRPQCRPCLGVENVWLVKFRRAWDRVKSNLKDLTDLTLTVETGIYLIPGYARAVGIQLGAFITLDRPRCDGSRKRKHESERLEKHIVKEGSE